MNVVLSRFLFQFLSWVQRALKSRNSHLYSVDHSICCSVHRCRSRQNFGHVKENDIHKKRLHFDFRCHFCKIKAHTAILRMFSHISHFDQISTDFAWILIDFSQIFNRWKLLGVRLHPASYTNGCVHSDSLRISNFWKKESNKHECILCFN